jgi:hypothetical protein
VDPTFREVIFVVWTQVELHWSIISATIPVLRPVVNNLNTSYSSLGPVVSSTGYAGSNSVYKLSTLRPSPNLSGRNSAFTASSHITEQTLDASAGASASVSNGARVKTTKRRASPSTDSIESHGSEQMIIRKQISWRVEHDAPKESK